VKHRQKNKSIESKAFPEQAAQPSSKRTYSTWMVLLMPKLISELPSSLSMETQALKNFIKQVLLKN
jgi:hypothetical protein